MIEYGEAHRKSSRCKNAISNIVEQLRGSAEVSSAESFVVRGFGAPKARRTSEDGSIVRLLALL